VLDTLPRAGGQPQTILDPGAAPAGAGPRPPDPAQVADTIARYRAYEALRDFRERLYGCPASRADALFELTDAILCADHAVTSPVQLSLVPAFRRGHGALYAGPADGRIDEEKLAVLLTGTLPQLVDGEQGRAWIAEHDTIDYGLLERALAGLPAQAAAQVREGVQRRRRRPAGHLRRRLQRRRADRRAGRLPGAPAGPAALRQRVLLRPGHLAREERPPRQVRAGSALPQGR
jgi:hypothetical protein